MAYSPSNKDTEDDVLFKAGKICLSGFLVNETNMLEPSGIKHNHITLKHYYDLANLVNTGWIMEQADGSFLFAANWGNGDDFDCAQEAFGEGVVEIFSNVTSNGYGVGEIRYQDKDGNMIIFHPSSCDAAQDTMYFTGRYYTDGTTFEERTLAIKPDGTFEVSLIVQP